MEGCAARYLLAASSFILALGGAMHAAAFSRAATALPTSGMPSFFVNSFKGLWAHRLRYPVDARVLFSD